MYILYIYTRQLYASENRRKEVLRSLLKVRQNSGSLTPVYIFTIDSANASTIAKKNLVMMKNIPK